MSITRALSVIPKRAMASHVSTTNIKSATANPKEVGYDVPGRADKYMNPLLTPPPRSPSSVSDFSNPRTLGHWTSLGYDYTSPVADNYIFHEVMFVMIVGGAWTFYLWNNSPDYKLRDWARREAFLRTHKREALGLPVIDINVVDPDRVCLPSEEELEKCPLRVTM